MAFEQTYEQQTGTPDRPRADRPITYRGFLIQQHAPFSLFGVVARDGYDLPAMLSGCFTNFEKLTAKVDMYFAEHPSSTAETAYVQRPKKRGRGRPRKIIGPDRPLGSSK